MISSTRLLRPLIVRGSQVRELVYQISVRPNLVCHVSVRVDSEEKIDNVVAQSHR